MLELRLYIANLGKYNEGILKGDWIEIPFAEDDLQELLNNIGINEKYEEYAIHDYETNFDCLFNYLKVGEHDSIQLLNELVEEIINLEVDITILDVLTSCYTGDLMESVAIVESGNYTVFHDVNNETDLGYAIIENTGMLDGLPNFVSNYLDYKAFGADVMVGNEIVIDKGIAIEVHY